MGNTLLTTRVIVAMEPNNKLAEMIQFMARAYRMGQKNNEVHCYILYSAGTVEESQMERNKGNL